MANDDATAARRARRIAIAREWIGRLTAYGRIGLRWLGRAAAVFAVLSALWVIAYRFINPPTTLLMQLEAYHEGSIRQDWRPLERLSPDLARAVVAAEDATFCSHWGVDFTAIDAAIRDWRRTGEMRGASTITQQAAKNLFLWPARTFIRKGFELWFAGLMELFLPKARILELYLNVAEFDRGVFGAEAASQHYFGVTADGLSLWRATRLAAILPAPKARDAADLGDALVARADVIADGARTLERFGADSCFAPDA